MHAITRLLLHASTPHTLSGTHMCQENFPAGAGRCLRTFRQVVLASILRAVLNKKKNRGW